MLAATLLAGPVAAREVPYLSGRVNDTAGMLSEGMRQQLEEKLAAFEKETGTQVAVLTIESLDGEVLEDYSERVASTWKLGRKGVDDGVLFLISKTDRKMRLEVGYGLEGKLTDAQSRRILDNLVRPRFREGGFDAGVLAGVDATLGTLRGQDVIPAEAPPVSATQSLKDVPWPMRLAFGGMFVLVIGVFSMLALFSKGCSAWFLYFFLMPFYLAFPMVFAGPIGGLADLRRVGDRLPDPQADAVVLAVGEALRVPPPGPGALRVVLGPLGRWRLELRRGGFSGGGGSFGGGGASSSW